MKIKKSVLTLLVLLVSICTSCSSSKPVRANTPDNTSLLLTMAITENNYDNFNSLFSDGRKNTISNEKLMEFNNISTAGFGNSLYELITFTNGEMLLVRYSAKKTDGE